MRKIQLNKTVEEFEINGEVYEMDTKDDKMMEYIKESRKLQLELDALEAKRTDEPEEVEEFMADVKDLLRNVIDLFFGKGEFKRMYKDCGESIQNVLIVVEEVTKYLNEYQAEKKAKQRDKYKR